MNKKARIIIASVVVVLIAAVSVYFLVWRTSDSDYQVAAGLATYAEKTNRVLTVELSAMQQPNQINVATPIKLQVLANSYKKAVDALAQNNAINRDLAVQSVFGKNKDALVKHSQSMIALADSVKLYASADSKCRRYTSSLEKKSDSYSQLLEACRLALSEGEKSQHDAFDDQFFTEYLEQMTARVEALDKVAAAPNDQASQTADTAAQELDKLGKVKLDFKSPNVIAITKELTTVLESQKKALLR